MSSREAGSLGLNDKRFQLHRGAGVPALDIECNVKN
jgi:hypothetical protein